ncbi:MAG: hypothetical protein WCP55_20460, partial [Lentisphaerota bacterium]
LEGEDARLERALVNPGCLGRLFVPGSRHSFPRRLGVAQRCSADARSGDYLPSESWYAASHPRSERLPESNQRGEY